MTLKLCGITTTEQANFIATHGVDIVNFIGFVFYKNSPRFISPQNAQNIVVQTLNDKINAVAVAVDPTMDELLEIIKCGFRWFQIHFSQQIQQLKRLETINFIKQKCHNAKFIMPFAISSLDDVLNIATDSTFAMANYILLDAKTQNHGGSGQVFNWSIFDNLPINIYNSTSGMLFNKPFFLSGGVSQQNILDGIRFTKNFDLSSSLETTRGVKDLKKIESFLAFYKSLIYNLQN